MRNIPCTCASSHSVYCCVHEWHGHYINAQYTHDIYINLLNSKFSILQYINYPLCFYGISCKNIIFISAMSSNTELRYSINFMKWHQLLNILYSFVIFIIRRILEHGVISFLYYWIFILSDKLYCIKCIWNLEIYIYRTIYVKHV